MFDGKPSKELSHRPFFSIVVACYQSHKTIGNLLQSIVNQNMEDDLEVIISDDCSEDLSYLDIVKQYEDILSIKYVQTDYNCCPGNTREKGISVAEGVWLAIADHDDEYIPNTLKLVKEKLLNNPGVVYGVGCFYQREPISNTIIKEHRFCANWNHAKFYNMDNLWKKYDIHFRKDMKGQEDIYISSIVDLHITAHNLKTLLIDVYCYYWNEWKDSLSHSATEKGHYGEITFRDYLDATGYTYLNYYKNYGILKKKVKWACIKVFGLGCYLINDFIYDYPDSYDKNTITILLDYLRDIKEVFKLTNQDIINYFKIENCYLIKQIEFGQNRTIFPRYTIYDFLKMSE